MWQLITSRNNSRIKEAAKLRSGRQRASQGKFLIDGAREISRALDAGVEVDAAFCCEALCGSETTSQMLPRIPADVLFGVTTEVFEKLAFGERRDGLVVVARSFQRSLDQMQLPPNPLVAVLVGLEKPGNVGAILRSADGAGIDAVIVADAGTDLLNPNTIRASLGTVFAPNVFASSSEDCIARLSELKVPLYATRLDAVLPYTEVDYRRGAAIVLGSEAAGLPEVWKSSAIQGVLLPMQGMADSLNVSATAAVMFYEAVRQKNA